MAARRRKLAARDPEDRIPSPPCYAAIPVKFSEKQQASHYLYVTAHGVRQGTKSTWSQKRTLFVLNVPPYCTEVS
ncbi:ribosomal RNA-processing protein 7 homolog A [Hylobates moloch]|uniref:ribosomal RNA-processing protein 7 homolog A n=1 Tax=Hylobates moloch TaxID=81572 RepID=UPI001364770E|nr:ribosomal RNA-processing protein 7 homolog A [Hylobates moloch]